MAIAGAIAAGLVARPEYSVLSHIDIGGSFALALVIALLAAAAAGPATACWWRSAASSPSWRR
jgi:hypothetical protein